MLSPRECNAAIKSIRGKRSVIIGVPREGFPGERRVALVPAVVPSLAKAGMEIAVEAGAGAQAGYTDAHMWRRAGRFLRTAEPVCAAEIVVQVLCYGSNDRTGKADLPLFRRGQGLVGFMRPLGSRGVVEEIAATGVISFSIELMPRITRAQSMDALSSMATVCGYKAVLIAADTCRGFYPCSQRRRVRSRPRAC